MRRDVGEWTLQGCRWTASSKNSYAGTDRIAILERSSVATIHGPERRFERDTVFRDQYTEQIDALWRAGHWHKGTRPPVALLYHLPHHVVTRKFRMVDDAPCKMDRGTSLNECQLRAERLQDYKGHLHYLTVDGRRTRKRSSTKTRKAVGWVEMEWAHRCAGIGGSCPVLSP